MAQQPENTFVPVALVSQPLAPWGQSLLVTVVMVIWFDLPVDFSCADIQNTIGIHCWLYLFVLSGILLSLLHLGVNLCS